MSQTLAKQAIRNTIKKLFSLQFDELKETKNYIELLKICKDINGLNVKQWLILKALDIIFIDNDKIKENLENAEAIKYFYYIIDKKDFDRDKEFLLFINHKKYKGAFENLNINSKEKSILEFICEVKKETKMLFDCIDSIYDLKLPNYVRSRCSYDFSGKFDDYLAQFELFFNYYDFDNEKEYISLEYNSEKQFYFKEYSYEEAESLNKNTERSSNFKDIKKYLSKNSIKLFVPPKDDDKKVSTKQNVTIDEKPAITNNKIEQTNNIESMDKEDIKIDFSKNENLMKLIKEEVKKEYENKFNSLKKQYDEKTNELKKQYDEKTNEIKKDYVERFNEMEKNNKELKKIYDQKIRQLKKNHESDINDLNKKISKQKKEHEILINKEKEKLKKLDTKFDSIKFTKQSLEKDNEIKAKEMMSLQRDKIELNSKLDIISCRALCKSIIDFLYYVFTSSFKGQSYFDEKNSIINEIESKKSGEFKSQKNILSEIIRYLNKIYDLKLEGDDFAHPEVNFDILIGLIGMGYENVNNLLKKLDLTVLFQRYNELYRLKSNGADIQNITYQIQFMLPEIRDNFLILIKEMN